MDFVDRIDEKLKEKNLKRISLCDDLGITHSALTDWKKRGTIPAGDVCLKIAQYLDVAPEWLLGGEERKGGESEFSEEEKAFACRLKNLTDEQKCALSALLDHYEKANNEALKKRLG